MKKLIIVTRVMPLLIVIFMLASCGPSDGWGVFSSDGVAPTITSADNATFTEGTSGTFTVTADGDPAPTFSLSGDALPSGITFNETTGVLSGTPDAGTNGTYSITITAGNGVSPDATQSFSLYVIGPSTTALIVYGAEGYPPLTNLTNIMTAAGLTVTTSNGVPAGDLSGYAQIWDVRYDTALTSDNITSYTAYLQSGGTLVIIGENAFFVNRNNSISSFISDLGGGSVTVIGDTSNSEAVQSPFNSPNALTTIAFGTSGYTASTGTGTFITKLNDTQGSSLYFARSTLTNAAAGRLMIVFDVDFLQSGGDYDSLIDNMVRLPNGSLPAFNTSTLPYTVAGSSGGYGGATLDANGNLLFVVNSADQIRSLDRSTGTVTTIATGVSGGYELLGITYDQGSIYVGTSNGNIYRVDPTTGVSTLLATISGDFINGLVIAPATFSPYGGQLIVATYSGHIYAVDQSVASPTPVQFAYTGTDASALVFDSAGTLYLADYMNNKIVTLTAAGVAADFVTTGLSAPDGLAFGNGVLYVANSDDDTIKSVTIPGGVVSTVTSFDFNGGWYPSPIVYDVTSNLLLLGTGTGSLIIDFYNL
jgi:sugar lactone lactonase YvrE